MMQHVQTWLRFFGSSLVIAASGCAMESPDRGMAAFPGAGLYTPGSVIGASDPTDTPQPGAGLGNRCVSLPALDPAAPATRGTLTLDYKTASLMGRYRPRNCTAVWIENPAGQYVATIEIGAALRRPALLFWQDHACTEKPGPDVVTTPTLKDHATPHQAVWNGLDFEGKPVPDGPYKLFIEVTESEDPGEFGMFDFMKSAEPYTDQELGVDVEGPIEQAKISWALMPEGAAGGATSGQ
jgi:hypothetical protein